MRELIFIRPGQLEWRQAADPTLQHPEDAIVRPVASTTCDIDCMFLHGRAPELFPGPFAIGHECVAEIVALGDGVSNRYPGQLVVVNWHIACGKCDRCRNGHPNACRNHPPHAAFGLPWRESWGGMFSDLLRVPYANFALTPLPPGVDPVHVASATDNISYGYENTVPHLKNAPGAPVLIMGGGGSIGLYSAMFAKAAGSSRVDYLDTDVARLAIAERFGANAIESAPPQRTKGRYPVVVDASASREGLQCALRSVEPEGIVASAGGHLEATVPLPLHEMWVRGLTLTIAPGPLGTTVAAVLDWVSAGRIRPEFVTSEVANFDDAPRILAEPSLKPVLARPPIHGAGHGRLPATSETKPT